MAGTQRADAGVSPPDLDVLVEGIQELLRMVRTVRQVGGSAQLPPRLVRICREVTEEADGHGQRGHGHPALTSPSARIEVEGVPEQVRDLDLREMPLRRLLWQVINPGETSFRVPTIVERLARLGVTVEPAKVSNALGYWVDRDRLIRESKGVYSCPSEKWAAGVEEAGSTDTGTGAAATRDFTDHGPRQQGAGHDHRVAGAARRQEDADGPAAVSQRRKAV